MQEFGFTDPVFPQGSEFDDAHLKVLLRSFFNCGGNLLGYRAWHADNEEGKARSEKEDQLLKPLVDLLQGLAERVTAQTLGTEEGAWYRCLSWHLAQAETPNVIERQIWAGEHERYGRYVLKWHDSLPGSGMDYLWEIIWISEEGLRHACVDAGIDLDEWRARPEWKIENKNSIENLLGAL